MNICSQKKQRQNNVCLRRILQQTIVMFSSLMESLFGPTIKDEELFVRMTYRSNIRKLLPTTNYTSDSGWGCMLRVVQMSLANLLCKRQGAKPRTVIPLCWDNSCMPFSIQVLTECSAELFPHKKPCEWYSPSEAGFLVQKVLQKFNLTYKVLVCNDGSLFLDEIPAQKENIVIMMMTRIGLDKPEQEYLDVLVDIMKSRFFFSILGGTPRYAHLFIKEKDGYLGFLDPHETRKAAQSEEQLLESLQEYQGQLEWIKREKISSSMCIMLTLKNNQIEQFWLQLNKMKSKWKQSFFLYFDLHRPLLEPDGIIQIEDFQ